MSKWSLGNDVSVFGSFLIFVESIYYQMFERGPALRQACAWEIWVVVPATCPLWLDVDYWQNVKKKLCYLWQGLC